MTVKKSGIIGALARTGATQLKMRAICLDLIQSYMTVEIY